jgi:citrate lyase beta subunit
LNAPRRPRRALLFCPGTERGKIEKAARSPADGVILDWEDAAALSRKAEARSITCAALSEVDFLGKERCVRINPHGSGLEQDDLDALAHCAIPPDCVMLPKTESAESVRFVSDRLGAIERSAKLERGAIRMLALVETALGVVRLRDIAFADDRIDALVFGAEDLCGDLGATRTAAGAEVAFAKSSLVVHAAAARKQAIDTPYVRLDDEDGLLAATRESLTFGYTGRLAIHPRQVEPILRVFTPSAEEIAAASRLVGEHERHQNEGRGVFELDGRMVDMPMVRAAERVLERARRAGISV